MIALLALVSFALQASSDAQLDGPPLDWTTDHAPFGMDITLDSKVWINTNPVGAKNDYAILANDLYKAVMGHSSYPRLWIRGYHRKNSNVSYRETKQLVAIDCVRDTVLVEKRLYYSATGDVLGSEGPLSPEPIVPGSIAESWRKAACGGSR